MIPNDHEVKLMVSLNKKVDDYYELKDITFELYQVLSMVVCHSSIADALMTQATDILTKCDDFEPEWKKFNDPTEA